MPFASMKQSRAAFGGYLGPEMKAKAKEWAGKTDYKDLPEKIGHAKEHYKRLHKKVKK